MSRLLLLLASASLLVACNNASQTKQDGPADSKPTAEFRVQSEAFEAGKPIPKRFAYTGEGDNVSPPLRWSGAPDGTQAFAIIVEDPDAPSPDAPREKPWVHWVLYGIPADTLALPVSSDSAIAGTNDFGELGWGGPMPPPGSGIHRYFFRVYALDKDLELKPGLTRDALLEAIGDYVSGTTELFGTYERHAE